MPQQNFRNGFPNRIIKQMPGNIQTGFETVTTEFNDAKSNFGKLTGSGSLGEKFEGAAGLFNNVKRNAPIVQEVIQNTTKAFKGTRSKPGQKTAPGSYSQSEKMGTKGATKVTGGVKNSNPSRGPAVGSSKRGVASGMNGFNQFEQLNGYNVMNTNGIPTSLSSLRDDSLYENPYVYQNIPEPNTGIKVRTVYNVITPTLFETGSEVASAIFDELFVGWKTEINEGTNGGTAVTRDVFVPDKVRNYLQKVYYMHFHLIELISRMAWATEDVNSNKALRMLGYSLTDKPELLVLRNRMASVLSNFVLPSNVYDYPYWLFQVYQTNEYNNSIDQLFMSEQMSTLLVEDGPDVYIASMRALVDELSVENQSEFSQISALFQAKTTSSWFNLRNIKAPSNTTHYDPSWNDIFNNRIFYYSLNGQGIGLQSVPPASEIQSCVFSTPLDSVQVHVTETFLPRFVSNKNFSALLFKDGYISSYPEGFENFNWSNKFLIYQNQGTPNGISCLVRNSHVTQVGNDAVTVFRAQGPIQASFDWSVKPVGQQYYLYDMAYNSVVLAQRIFAAKMFA